MMTLTARDLDFGIDVSQYGAESPAEYRGVARDHVKMLVIDRKANKLTDSSFWQLPDFLTSGDVLVVNNSLTIPARLAVTSHGESHVIHLAARLSPTRFIVERRGPDGEADARAYQPSDMICVMDPKALTLPVKHNTLIQTTALARLTVIRRFHPNSRLWEVEATRDLYQLAQSIGSPVRYSYLKATTGLSDYKTIFGRVPGSSEMPSASRPFTRPILRQLAGKGVKVASITLHTSVSSHEVENDLSTHPVLPEWFCVPASSASLINQAKDEGRRVIAVGTTAVRAVESALRIDGTVEVRQGWTTHLVTPSTPPQAVNALVTGMHDNQTSHLALMYAFLARERLSDAYQFATEKDYLWHEFGDISLIL